jgi:hypothetical protein
LIGKVEKEGFYKSYQLVQWESEYCILSSISSHFFYIENDAEIFLAHYTWKVAEKGFKMAFMMYKLINLQ